MHYDEVRDMMDLPEREAPVNPMMGHNGGPPIEPEPEKKPAKPKTPVEENDDDE
jgi:hypothetical protein